MSKNQFTRAGRVRVPSMRRIRFISMGGIVVVGRSVGAVAITRGVRSMVSIVSGGIAAVSSIGTGGHHRRLAGIPAHMNLLVISAPLIPNKTQL